MGLAPTSVRQSTIGDVAVERVSEPIRAGSVVHQKRFEPAPSLSLTQFGAVERRRDQIGLDDVAGHRSLAQQGPVLGGQHVDASGHQRLDVLGERIAATLAGRCDEFEQEEGVAAGAVGDLLKAVCFLPPPANSGHRSGALRQFRPDPWPSGSSSTTSASARTNPGPTRWVATMNQGCRAARAPSALSTSIEPVSKRWTSSAKIATGRSIAALECVSGHDE